MIRIRKSAAPDVLVANAAVWTAEYAGLVAAGRSSAFARHRHPDIKAAVLRETHHKCAYCEAKMRHVDFGDVEHVYPKRHRPDLVVAWTNLTLACAVCNTFKAHYYSTTSPLVHPYEEDPATHVVFLGPMVFHIPGDAKGERTWKRLRLNRVELLERRAERLEAIQTLIDRWKHLDDPNDRDLIRAEILRECADDREFAAAIRAFLGHVGWR
jgi:uncharacterized protein (TIGR02646 family)